MASPKEVVFKPFTYLCERMSTSYEALASKYIKEISLYFLLLGYNKGGKSNKIACNYI